MGKFMTGPQKVILRSILWCILAFVITKAVEGDFEDFAVLCSPVIMYWAGACIFGFGYLKKLAELFDFNLYAFIFSSFYYWYKKLSYWFVFYVYFPMILSYIMMLLLSSVISRDDAYIMVCIGYFMSHILAGFRANRDIRAYHKYMAEVAENANPDAPVTYFSVSVARLVFLSVLSFGIYTVYWLYKNWKAVHTATKEDFIPFFRSWLFGIFFIYPLYTRIKKAVQKVQPVGSFFRISCILLIIVWVVDIVLQMKIVQSFFSEGILLCTWVLLSLAGALLLIPAQKAIYAVNKSIDAKHTPSTSFARGEIIIIVIGLFLWISSISGLFIENKPMDEIQNSAVRTLNFPQNGEAVSAAIDLSGQKGTGEKQGAQAFGTQESERRATSGSVSGIAESDVTGIAESSVQGIAENGKPGNAEVGVSEIAEGGKPGITEGNIQTGGFKVAGTRQSGESPDGDLKMDGEDAVAVMISLYIQETVFIPDICAEAGYDMQDYPRVFEQTYQAEYDLLRRVLQKEGMTMKNGQDIILNLYGQQLRQKVAAQLEELRRSYILMSVSEQYGVPVENLTWAEAFSDLMAPEQVCAVLDENAAVILGEDPYRKSFIDAAVETLRKNPALF